MTIWKEFEHRGYKGIAVWRPADEEQEGEWIGEFNYPVRRVAHAFIGKTQEEAYRQFMAGVDSYYCHVEQVPMMRPEPEGICGVMELMEMERRGREYELSILHWPLAIHPHFVLVIKDLVSMSHTSISYNQAALDELHALLESRPTITLAQFRIWAERVWRKGELERTAAGICITKSRDAIP